MTASSVFVENRFGCFRKTNISKTSKKGQNRHDASNGERVDSAVDGYNSPADYLLLRKIDLNIYGEKFRTSIVREGIRPTAMGLTRSLSYLFEHFELFGLLACLIILAALSILIPMYTGRAGEKNSIWNHFVSELGEVGVSLGAKVFNGGLIAAGALFIPFALGLGFSIQYLWDEFGMIAGIGTAVWLLLIGVFPINNLKPHIIAALSFFDGGLVTILLFTIGFWVQPAGTEILPRGHVMDRGRLHFYLYRVPDIETQAVAGYRGRRFPPPGSFEKPTGDLDDAHFGMACCSLEYPMVP